MKKFITIFILFLFLDSAAQLIQGSVATDFSVSDLNGNQLNLYSQLDSGRTVVLHCFTAWDSYAWEYYQQQTLDAFAALYGPQGSGDVAVWRVECETQNTLAQLQGPAYLAGTNATNTQGDWLSESSLPIIDDSTLAAQFNLEYVPLLVVICPDRVVRFADQIALGNLTNLVFQSSCPPVMNGFDPALISAATSRSCGSNLVDVTLVIKNLGTDTLQTLLVSIGGAVADQSVEWSGSLPSYSSDTLVVSGAEILTDANIRCQIETVNLNAANDTVRVRADVGLSTQLVRLELALDAYPDDVSWEIRNETDSVLYNGGGYEVDYQYISNVFQLPTVGCYNFYLYDTNGDGLHGSQYGGFDGFCKLYSMTDSSTIEEELFFYDGSYNFSPIDNNPSFLQYTFEAGSSLQVNEQLSAQWMIYPNPADGELNINVPGAHESIKIRVVDTTGKLHLDELMPAGQYLHTIDLQQLSNGYYILVTESKGQRTQQSFIVTHN
jgi:hypothetical protein